MKALLVTQTVQKWGNSMGVRLPKKVISAAGLSHNQPLSVSLQGKSIVLTPLPTNNDFTLETMLEGVTPKNVHKEIEWGADKGAERIDS